MLYNQNTFEVIAADDIGTLSEAESIVINVSSVNLSPTAMDVKAYGDEDTEVFSWILSGADTEGEVLGFRISADFSAPFYLDQNLTIPLEVNKIYQATENQLTIYMRNLEDELSNFDWDESWWSKIQGTNFESVPTKIGDSYDLFEYRSFDGYSYSDASIGGIVVNPINEAPSAKEVSVVGSEDQEVQIILEGSDGDFELQEISQTPAQWDDEYAHNDKLEKITFLSLPAGGDIHFNSNTSEIVEIGKEYLITGYDYEVVKFYPHSDWNGSTEFTYSFSDGEIFSLASKVEILIEPVPDPPKGTPTAVLEAGLKNTVYKIDVDSLIEGITDPDGDELTVEITNVYEKNVTGHTGSALVVTNTNSTFEIVPNIDYVGEVAVEYQISDGEFDPISAVLNFDII